MGVGQYKKMTGRGAVLGVAVIVTLRGSGGKAGKRQASGQGSTVEGSITQACCFWSGLRVCTALLQHSSTVSTQLLPRATHNFCIHVLQPQLLNNKAVGLKVVLAQVR